MYAGFDIIEWLIPKNEWTRPGRKITPEGLAIHWTGNIKKGAKAWNNANFFHNRVGTYGSAPYILDDEKTYCVIPENEEAFHVGAKKYYTTAFGPHPNKTLIGLEICVNMDSDWSKTYDRAVRFSAAICKKYNWLDPRKYLVRHYDVTRKDCPLMWTPFINNAVHVRNSVISMLFPRISGETDAVYAARLKANEAEIQAGIKWVNSMTANGKLGDAGWNQFLTDVASAIKGKYKITPEPKPEPPKTDEEKVVYYMGKYFDDVQDETWKGVAVNQLHEMKLADGNPILAGSRDQKGKLVARPDDPITRAETAALISRAVRYAIEQVKK